MRWISILAKHRFSLLDTIWIIWSFHLWYVDKAFWQSIVVLLVGALMVGAVEVFLGMHNQERSK